MAKAEKRDLFGVFYRHFDSSGQFAAIRAVNTVGELQGQYVFARGQGHFRAGLSFSEMQVSRVFGYCQTCGNGVTGVYQQMVMSRSGNDSAGSIEIQSIYA